MKLKQYLLASAVCMLPVAASAADLPMKAPPMRVVQPIPFSWTGFYIGGSAGFISQKTTETDIDGAFALPGDTTAVAGIGGIFGVNAGYNYQMGQWVFGIEADYSGTTLNDTGISLGGGLITVTSKLKSLGTVRGRIGYAFDRALLYATGGFAYGDVRNALNFAPDPIEGGSTSSWQTGWTVGGGLEYAITNNWTVRAEGLYVDLGTNQATGIIDTSTGCRYGFKNRYVLGRLGVNYKF